MKALNGESHRSPLKQAISRPQWLWYHAALRPCIMWAISSLKSYCEERRGPFFSLSLSLFLNFPKCSFANHKTNQVEILSQNYRFTGAVWKRPLTTNRDWLVGSRGEKASNELNVPPARLHPCPVRWGPDVDDQEWNIVQQVLYLKHH